MTFDPIAAVYGRVPAIDCKGLCHASCGPAPMTPAEYERIAGAYGKPVPPSRDGITCPLLTADRKCSVYAARPLVCRVWGVVDSLPCPHGCKPNKRLTDNDAFRLFKRMKRISPGAPVCLVEGWRRLRNG